MYVVNANQSNNECYRSYLEGGNCCRPNQPWAAFISAVVGLTYAHLLSWQQFLSLIWRTTGHASSYNDDTRPPVIFTLTPSNDGHLNLQPFIESGSYFALKS